MSVSAAPLSAGAIRLTLDLPKARPGTEVAARGIRIASTRPIGSTSALLVGRSAADVPLIMARLHALCGRAHMVAAEVAIIAALDRDVDVVVQERFDALLAERLGELLRSTVMGPERLVSTDREVLADVRAVLASVNTLDGGGRPSGSVETGGVRERIRHGLDRLGLRIDRAGRFQAISGSWAAGLLERFGPVTGDVFLPCDRLSADDDAAIVAALSRAPTDFAIAPHLAGRRPETGPTARAANGPGMTDGTRRLVARLAEIAEAAELLEAPAADRLRLQSEWVGHGRLDRRLGWAAVESPRGRLHHLARLDDDGRIAAYAVLAPTEWNFHPDGPLVATLLANRWGRGVDDLTRAERIAGLFDPCVGFEVAIGGIDHA